MRPRRRELALGLEQHREARDREQRVGVVEAEPLLALLQLGLEHRLRLLQAVAVLQELQQPHC